MSLLPSIYKLHSKFTNETASREKVAKVLTIYFSAKNSEQNGMEYAEEVGLALALNGQESFSDSLLKLIRSMPDSSSSIIYLIFLISDIQTLLKKPQTQKNQLKKPINQIVKVPEKMYKMENLSSYFQTKPFFDFQAPKNIKCIDNPQNIQNFEQFYALRFGDVYNSEIHILKKNDISLFIQSILCGRKSNFTSIEHNTIFLTQKIRFEDHSFLSTRSLTSKFLEIGNSRLKICNLLRNDAISFDIKHHLTKFDAYMSTLKDFSPGVILSKIRPFRDVFNWFCILLQQPTFTEIHGELVLAAQTKFKAQFALQIWSTTFEERVRPLYNYAFNTELFGKPFGISPFNENDNEMSNNQNEPVIMDLFKPISFEILNAGKLLRMLHDTAPAHPFFKISRDFEDSFLLLENRVDEYKSSCERVIEIIKREWRNFYRKAREKKYQVFEEKRARIKEELRLEDLKMEAKQAEEEKERRERFRELEEEARKREQIRRDQAEKEKEEERQMLERNLSRKAANPLMRPLTEEEQHLVELEKIDLFLEFSEKMKALGASEEQIMKFFPELSLPEDEIDALLGETTLVNQKRNQNITENDGKKEDIQMDRNFQNIVNEKEERKEQNDDTIEEDTQEEIKEHNYNLSEEEQENNDFFSDDTEKGNDNYSKSIESEASIISDDIADDPLPDILPAGPKLTTIPALFHRVVLPSFKIQYEMVSKALYSILIERDHFRQQMISFWKLFLMEESTIMDEFIMEYSSLPYEKSINIKKSESFSKAGKKLGIEAEFSFQIFGKPASSVSELIEEIEKMNILIKVDSKFDVLLQDIIMRQYVPIFKFLLLLNISGRAIGQLFRFQRDSYGFKPNPIDVHSITQFVVTTQTYFTSELAKSKVNFDLLFLKCNTVNDFINQHESLLNSIRTQLLLTPQCSIFGKPLTQALQEVCKFIYDPIIGQKRPKINDFHRYASTLATTVHEFHSSNETLSFLDILYSDYI